MSPLGTLGRDQDQSGWGGQPLPIPAEGRQNFLHREELPYSRAGLLMEKTSGYVKISIRLVLNFLWNEEDSALVRAFSQLPIAPITLHRS